MKSKGHMKKQGRGVLTKNGRAQTRAVVFNLIDIYSFGPLGNEAKAKIKNSQERFYFCYCKKRQQGKNSYKNYRQEAKGKS